MVPSSMPSTAALIVAQPMLIQVTAPTKARRLAPAFAACGLAAGLGGGGGAAAGGFAVIDSDGGGGGGGGVPSLRGLFVFGSVMGLGPIYVTQIISTQIGRAHV